MTETTLLVENLHRVFKRRGAEPFAALRGIDLQAQRGQVIGVLGPNGAGKTTLVRTCATLLTPTSGSVLVAGFDVVRQTSSVRRNIGLVLGGDRGFYGRATALETLMLIGDPASALGYLQRGLELCRELGATEGECRTLNCLADTFCQLGRADEALVLARSNLVLARTVGNPQVETLALFSVGNAHFACGGLDQSRQCFERGLELVDQAKMGALPLDVRRARERLSQIAALGNTSE